MEKSKQVLNVFWPSMFCDQVSGKQNLSLGNHSLKEVIQYDISLKDDFLKKRKREPVDRREPKQTLLKEITLPKWKKES